MSRPLRVLQVIQNLNYGGMERLLADLVRRLPREQFESHILALDYLGRFAEGLESSATLHVAGRQPRWSMLWPGKLARQIAAIGPDVVHSHAGVWFKVSLAARLARVPLVVHTEHGRQHPDPLHGRIEHWIASRRTDYTVAVSERLARQLAETVVADPRRLRVITNGVDTILFAPAPDTGRLRLELGVPPDTPILGSIGRLQQIKGYDVVAEAFGRLRGRWSGPDAPILLVAGEGSERGRIEATLDRHGVKDAARFPGWRDDVHDLHATFTLFTMGSRSEGTSVSLLEAMSAGLCPVVTDVGGNRAVLGPELAHRLVPSEDPDALAAAWEAALRDPSARTRDAALARTRVERAFSLDAMVQGYARLYRREATALD